MPTAKLQRKTKNRSSSQKQPNNYCFPAHFLAYNEKIGTFFSANVLKMKSGL